MPTSPRRPAPRIPLTTDTLAAPAPTAPASSITARIESLPGGRVRISLPGVRGWAGVARTPHELARVLQAAFTEQQIAAYVTQRGGRTDLDRLTEPVHGDPLAGPVRARRGRPVASDGAGHGPAATHRPGQAPPSQWVPMPGGAWRSPAGRVYAAGTATADRVQSRRLAAGLPIECQETA